MAKLLTEAEMMEKMITAIVWVEEKIGPYAPVYPLALILTPWVKEYCDGVPSRRDCRYWDSEPTYEERKAAPWKEEDNV